MTSPTRANSWFLLLGFPLFGGFLSSIAFGMATRLALIGAEIFEIIFIIGWILYAIPNIITAFVAITADLRRSLRGCLSLIFTSFIAHGLFFSATLTKGSTPLGSIGGTTIGILTACGVFSTLVLSTFLAPATPPDTSDNQPS